MVTAARSTSAGSARKLFRPISRGYRTLLLLPWVPLLRLAPWQLGPPSCRRARWRRAGIRPDYPAAVAHCTRTCRRPPPPLYPVVSLYPVTCLTGYSPFTPRKVVPIPNFIQRCRRISRPVTIKMVNLFVNHKFYFTRHLSVRIGVQ